MKLSKRVIKGRFKGVELLLPSKKRTRSSKSIVLESYFNTLQFDIVDSVFVELFAGSGSVGIEALSRGAKKVYFFERDREALNSLKTNIAKTDKKLCCVIEGDTFENFSQLFETIGEDSFIYIDPPFSIREGEEDVYNKMISMIKHIPPKAVRLITIEHMSALELPDLIGLFKLKKSKKFGKTTLSYYGV